jgi:hypothetical protein
VTLAEVGELLVAQGVPQLLSIGQVMNKLTGALKVTGVAGGTTTTRGIALASTMLLRQEVCETIQATLVLPPQAEVFC